MGFSRWPVMAGVALIMGTVASAGAALPTAASATPPTHFIPGLNLLDNNGATTGAAEPSIKVDSGGHIYVTGPAGVPTGGCPLWYIHPDTLNAKKLPYEYRGKFDTDNGSVGGGDCDVATGGLPAANDPGRSLSVHRRG